MNVRICLQFKENDGQTIILKNKFFFFGNRMSEHGENLDFFEYSLFYRFDFGTM